MSEIAAAAMVSKPTAADAVAVITSELGVAVERGDKTPVDAAREVREVRKAKSRQQACEDLRKKIAEDEANRKAKRDGIIREGKCFEMTVTVWIAGEAEISTQEIVELIESDDDRAAEVTDFRPVERRAPAVSSDISHHPTGPAALSP